MNHNHEYTKVIIDGKSLTYEQKTSQKWGLI